MRLFYGNPRPDANEHWGGFLNPKKVMWRFQLPGSRKIVGHYYAHNVLFS